MTKIDEAERTDQVPETETTTTEIAVPGLAWVEETLRTGIVPESYNSGDLSREIAVGLLTATTPEQVLGQGVTEKAKDNLGRSFMAFSVKFQPSDFSEEAGCPVYAVVDGAWSDTGEAMTLTCGGWSVVGAFLVLARIGAFPRPLKVEQAARATSNGYYPLALREG